MGHTIGYYRFRRNDVLKEKLKGKPHATNVVFVEDPLDIEHGDDLTEEMTLFIF